MAYWTYSSEVDLTNSGANDTLSFNFGSLPAGILEIDVIVNIQSAVSSNHSMYIRLGDEDGIVATGYNNLCRFDLTLEASTTLFRSCPNANQDAGDLHSTSHHIYRFHPDQHTWISRGFRANTAGNNTAFGCGIVTLSKELTQVTFYSPSAMDSGTAQIRYALNA